MKSEEIMLSEKEKTTVYKTTLCVEEKECGLWTHIVDSEVATVDKVLKAYQQMKSNGNNVRLVAVKEIVYFEVIDGEGF